MLGSEEGENYFTILKLSIYTIKRIWAESPKCSRWKSKEKAQLTVLYLDLKLMLRHELVLIAHDQSRPLFLSVPTVLMSRPLLLSVPTVLMSRPQLHVVTSFLGCDHFAVCKTTSCCDFDFLVAIMLVVFLSS